MQFDKSTILDLLRQQGKNDQADQDSPTRSTPTSTPTCSNGSALTPRSCWAGSPAACPEASHLHPLLQEPTFQPQAEGISRPAATPPPRQPSTTT